MPTITKGGGQKEERISYPEQVTVLVPEIDNVKEGRPINYVVLKAGNQEEYNTLLK